MRVKIFRILAACALALSCASPALAHGETQTSDPEDGARLRRAPETVSFTLSEAPAPDSLLVVTDGCNNEVGSDVSVDGTTLSASVADAQPGKWTMRFRAVSAEDGHLTKDGISFTVQGKKDCTPDDGGNGKGNEGNGNGTNAGGDQAAPNDDNGDDGSSFPVIPVALGTLALIGVAFFVRRSAAD